MSLSQYSLQLISEECRLLLLNARLDQVRQLDSRQISFQFYAGMRGRLDLLISLEPAHNWLYLSRLRPQSQTPDARVMLLRKMLQGQHLTALEQFSEDRVLRLEWQNGFALVLELSGRHANLFLLDPHNLIQLSWFQSHSLRQLVPGKPYQAPVSPGFVAARDPFALASCPADGSRSLLLEQSHQRYQATEQWRSRSLQLEQALKRRLKKLNQEIGRLDQDFEALDQAELWKKRGELLQSAYGQVSKGQTEVMVLDYYDPEQKLVCIPLDPQFDLNQNIQRCFRRGRKTERAAERALEILPERESERIEVQAALKQLELLQTSFPAMQTPQSECPETDCWAQLTALEQDWLPRLTAKQALASHSVAAEKQPYRRFVSLTGKEIRVGKKARDNDALSFRLANGRDLWLHARNLTGSHVIVSLNKAEIIDEQSLLDAATLAVYFSKARQEHKAEVMYAAVKHLKKPKGVPAGQVSVSNARTLIVEMEAERLERLLAQGRPHG